MQETVGTHPLWHLPLPAPFHTVHADTVIVTWIAMAFALLIVGLLASTHPITVVSKRYSVMELLVSYLAETTTGILGKNGLPFVPFIISLFLFILLLNEVGLFPLIGKSPTADLNTTAALAVTTILLIQIVGISRHGLGYYKHLIIKPTLDRALAMGEASTTSDDRDNVHWFKATSDVAFTFNLAVFEIDRSATFSGRQFYLDPAGGEKLGDGSLRVRHLTSQEARRLYGKS